MPDPSAPSSHQVTQAVNTLDQVKDYLRAQPPAADALALLTPLLDEDAGVPIVLGDILRSAARLVSQQAGRSMDDQVRRIIDGLREAAQEATDWHVLHWDVQRLRGRFPQTPEAPTTR